MSEFLCTVKLSRPWLAQHNDNLDKAVRGMMAPYKPALWSRYTMGGRGEGIYPLRSATGPWMIYRRHPSDPVRSYALAREALDDFDASKHRVFRASSMYRQRRLDLRGTVRIMGQQWAEVLRTHDEKSFVHKYSPCFGLLLTASGLDDQGWIDFEGPTTEEPFWLGPPDLALQRAKEFESRFLDDAKPDDILVCVDCDP